MTKQSKTLVKEATGLGIEVDGRWGDETLQEKIDAARAARATEQEGKAEGDEKNAGANAGGNEEGQPQGGENPVAGAAVPADAGREPAAGGDRSGSDPRNGAPASGGDGGEGAPGDVLGETGQGIGDAGGREGAATAADAAAKMADQLSSGDLPGYGDAPGAPGTGEPASAPGDGAKDPAATQESDAPSGDGDAETGARDQAAQAASGQPPVGVTAAEWAELTADPEKALAEAMALAAGPPAAAFEAASSVYDALEDDLEPVADSWFCCDATAALDAHVALILVAVPFVRRWPEAPSEALYGHTATGAPGLGLTKPWSELTPAARIAWNTFRAVLIDVDMFKRIEAAEAAARQRADNRPAPRKLPIDETTLEEVDDPLAASELGRMMAERAAS